MIYTVTFNPAIDYVMDVKALYTGQTNRSQSERFYIGGKGINVSLVLKELGVESTALGFCAGFTGDAILSGLEEKGIRTDFVRLEGGNSRINVKLRSKEETEINGQGPEITPSDTERLFERLENLTSGDTLVLAGSIPKSLPDSIYEDIIGRLEGRDIRVVVDATGRLLVNVLKYRPFLIKPNLQELGEIFGNIPQNDTEIIKCAEGLKELGAVNVLVSMASQGALLLDENGIIHRQAAAKGHTVNSVGAGDSMVAGFIAGFAQSGDYGYALRLGSAAGAATAFSEDLATSAEIKRIFDLCKNTERV